MPKGSGDYPVDDRFDSQYFEGKRSATVSSPVEEVRESARAWAQDVGWKYVSNENGILSFQIGQRLIWGGVEAEVSAHRSGESTFVQFVVRTTRQYSSLIDDVDWAAYTFANAVLSDLAARGATVDPALLAEPRSDRARRKAVERYRSRSQWVWAGLAIPVCVALWFSTQNFFWVLAAFCWLGELFFVGEWLRLRAIGMRAYWPLFVLIIPVFCAAVIGTVIAPLVDAGLVQVVA